MNTEVPSTLPPPLRRIFHALSCYRKFVTKQGLWIRSTRSNCRSHWIYLWPLPLPLLRSAELKQHVEHVVDTTQAARRSGAEKLDGIGGPAEAENSIALQLTRTKYGADNTKSLFLEHIPST